MKFTSGSIATSGSATPNKSQAPSKKTISDIQQHRSSFQFVTIFHNSICSSKKSKNEGFLLRSVSITDLCKQITKFSFALVVPT